MKLKKKFKSWLQKAFILLIGLSVGLVIYEMIVKPSINTSLHQSDKKIKSPMRTEKKISFISHLAFAIISVGLFQYLYGVVEAHCAFIEAQNGSYKHLAKAILLLALIFTCVNILLYQTERFLKFILYRVIRPIHMKFSKIKKTS